MLVSRYRWILILQFQDFCIIFAAIIVFLLFFNTYIFQAGLVSILVRKFKLTMLITFTYFGLCIGLHIWTMTLKWSDPKLHIDKQLFWLLNGFQKMCALIYYFEYKRTALKLADARFYHSSEWLQLEFERRK